jgi:hypothetical protein
MTVYKNCVFALVFRRGWKLAVVRAMLTCALKNLPASLSLSPELFLG